MTKQEIMKILEETGYYDGERRNSSQVASTFYNIANKLEVVKSIEEANLKEEISQLKAKIFVYEEVIKKSNFKTLLESESE